MTPEDYKQLPTAKEFAKNNHPMKTYPVDWNVMIEFAKLHVKAALESAAEKAEWEYPDSVNYKSILNAYPLDNIK